MAYLPGKFVWFEHHSADPDRARAFYEPLFGWRTETMPLGDLQYSMILNGADGAGGWCRSDEARARWVGHLSVPDVDAVYARALAAGSTAEAEPMDYGPVGRGAAVVDPVGARLSLWKSAQEDMPDTPAPAVGSFCWNELWAPDAARALAFYRELIGYGTVPMNMGDQGTYHLLTTGETMRAGIMQAPPGVPPQWLPYVQVGDVDGVVAKARAEGASVMLDAQDVPEVGRIAIFVDPQGASLGIIKSLAA